MLFCLDDELLRHFDQEMITFTIFTGINTNILILFSSRLKINVGIESLNEANDAAIGTQSKLLTKHKFYDCAIASQHQ